LQRAGYVGVGSAIVIGLIAGSLSFWSCHAIKAHLRIDDALEVSSVHGVSSFVGTLAVGFFAYRGEKSGAGLTDGRGLFFGGGISLLLIQLLALIVCAAWSASLTWIIVEGLQRAGVQLRPPEGHEEHGIDFVTHGER
jgi:Amt family ammonium transporter